MTSKPYLIFEDGDLVFRAATFKEALDAVGVPLSQFQRSVPSDGNVIWWRHSIPSSRSGEVGTLIIIEGPKLRDKDGNIIFPDEEKNPVGKIFIHSSGNHIFKTGDVLLPAKDIEHESEWKGSPGYDKSRVYFWDLAALDSDNYYPMADDPYYRHWVVDPVGKISADPEVAASKKRGEEGEWYYPYWFVAKKAKIIREVTQDELFDLAKNKQRNPPSTFWVKLRDLDFFEWYMKGGCGEPHATHEGTTCVATIHDLANKMKHGYAIDPIEVSRNTGSGKKWIVMGGHHRANAAKIAGLDGIVAIEVASNPPSTFWGRSGAGILFICPDDGTLMLLKRSAEVQEPNTWGISGGSCDGEDFCGEDECEPVSMDDAWECAKRETKEELGYFPKDYMTQREIIYKQGKFEYTTFVVSVSLAEKKNIIKKHKLSWENDEIMWERPDDWDLDCPSLHFGVQYVLKELKKG